MARAIFQERELPAPIRGGGLDIRPVLVEALPEMPRRRKNEPIRQTMKKHPRLLVSTAFAALACAGVTLSAQQPSQSVAESAKAHVLCKLCGAKYPDVKMLLRNTCPRNHGGKHILFEGEVAEKYICENCGITYSSLKDLTRNTCPHGNGAAHVPYRGGIKTEYTCRWCGRKYKSLKDMTRTSCPKQPDDKGNHRPAGM